MTSINSTWKDIPSLAYSGINELFNNIINGDIHLRKLNILECFYVWYLLVAFYLLFVGGQKIQKHYNQN